MVLFNTTFSVDAGLADAFVEFVVNVYLPAAEVSDMYAPLLTELCGRNESGMNGQPTRTFALQLRAQSHKVIDEFKEDVLPELYHLIGSQWGMGVAMFESVLDVVHDPARK